jgi:hypothetical protein
MYTKPGTKYNKLLHRPVISATWEVKKGRLRIKASPGKKAIVTLSQIRQAWWYTPIIHYMRGFCSKAGPRQKSMRHNLGNKAKQKKEVGFELWFQW